MSQTTYPTKTTDVFQISGQRLSTAIYERVKRHEEERVQCLEELARVIEMTSESPEDAPKNAAGLMMTLRLNKHLTGQALVAQAWLDRAVYLTDEIYDLYCIVKNIDKNSNYDIGLEEAKRYGMV